MMREIKINSIDELDCFLKAVNAEILQHSPQNDGDLPAYSMLECNYEAANLMAYVEAQENWTPAYYGCGLISRCLFVAQENGAVITPDFFRSLGYSDMAESMSSIRWY